MADNPNHHLTISDDDLWTVGVELGSQVHILLQGASTGLRLRIPRYAESGGGPSKYLSTNKIDRAAAMLVEPQPACPMQRH